MDRNHEYRPYDDPIARCLWKLKITYIMGSDTELCSKEADRIFNTLSRYLEGGWYEDLSDILHCNTTLLKVILLKTKKKHFSLVERQKDVLLYEYIDEYVLSRRKKGKRKYTETMSILDTFLSSYYTDTKQIAEKIRAGEIDKDQMFILEPFVKLFTAALSAESNKLLEAYLFMLEKDPETLKRRLKRIKKGSWIFETETYNRVKNKELFDFINIYSEPAILNLANIQTFDFFFENWNFFLGLESNSKSYRGHKNSVIGNQYQLRISEFFAVPLKSVFISNIPGNKLPDYIPMKNDGSSFFPLFVEIKTPQERKLRKNIWAAIDHCVKKLPNLPGFCSYFNINPDETIICAGEIVTFPCVEAIELSNESIENLIAGMDFKVDCLLMQIMNLDGSTQRKLLF